MSLPSTPCRSVRSLLHRVLAPAFRPVQARVSRAVVGQTAVGCALAVVLVGAVLAVCGLSALPGLALIAPFGATALLVIAVPNSPLSQPRAALLGNCGAALIGTVTAQAVPVPLLAAGLALALAVGFMLAARALHPPAGALALIPALSPDLVTSPGLGFVLAPVAAETVLLLGFALVWHRLTGRVYPLRAPDAVPRAAARFSRADLAAILERLRLSQNIGVADFARLLAAADDISAAQDRTKGLCCADAAGPCPPLLAPGMTLDLARDLMLAQRAHALPVVAQDGRLLGILTQSDLLRAPGADSVAAAMTRGPRHLPAAAPLRDALSVLAQGGWRAVPLTDTKGHCTGLLTRADLIAVLAPAPRDPPLPDAATRAKPSG